MKTADLRGYREGTVKPVAAQALNEKDAMVHSDGRWVSGKVFEFTASCCGGVQVFEAAIDQGGTLERAGASYKVIP